MGTNNATSVTLIGSSGFISHVLLILFGTCTLV